MPSRLARGNNTKASARLDALFRVMVRLSCIISGQRAVAAAGRNELAAGHRFGRESDSKGDAAGVAGAIFAVCESLNPGRHLSPHCWSLAPVCGSGVVNGGGNGCFFDEKRPPKSR